MKKSKAYKRSGKLFRYNYDHCTVEWITKATEKEYADNEEWMVKWNSKLWNIDDDGYIVIDSVGLSKPNWMHKNMRDSYLDMWIDEIEEELSCLANDFLTFG